MSMKIYEIDGAIRQIMDEAEESGYTAEVCQLLDNLDIARDKALESYGLYIKELKSEREAIKEAIAKMNEKLKQKDKHIERSTHYYAEALKGQKFKSPLVSCYYRKSVSVDVDNDLIEYLPDEFKSITVNPNKTEIGKALKEGAILRGCSLVEKESLVIR